MFEVLGIFRKSLISKVFLIGNAVLLTVVCGVAQTVVDRTVATVDDRVGRPELITYSDLVWTLALQPGIQLARPSSEDLNRALELVINQRLIAIEAKRLPGAPPSEERINKEINRILSLFPSTLEFEKRLRLVGFESVKDDNFERMMEERVKIEQYLDFRFRSFVVINSDEEQRYYRDVFAPDFRRRYPGLLMPSFDDKRLEINEILTEQRVADNLEEFLDDAKQRAEIVILTNEAGSAGGGQTSDGSR
jgi:hypothetical protein